MDRPICFFSDYGYTDDFAGVCRAVIARLAPEARVIDVTHGLPERDLLAGAVVLRNTLPYMPDKAVILAVVDPGVGGPRRPIALRSHGDHLFVGPDNGLLMHAADADGGVSDAYLLSNQDLWLVPLSATFHGRDIFAPVAARLAAGLELASVGTPVSPAEPRRHRDGLTAIAVLVDRFGNVALNLRSRDLEKAHLTDTVELLTNGERYHARVARTFASVRASDIVVLIDSYGQASVAVNNGSAAEVLGLDAGDEVRLRRLG
jgi:S-adenosylmethionine hydrolase